MIATPLTASIEPAADPAIQPLLLSRKETADFLGISERSVFRMAKSGELPHVRLGGRILHRRTDCEALVAARATTTWTGKPRAPRKPGEVTATNRELVRR